MTEALSTFKIEEELNNYLGTAYPSLYKEYILFTVAIAIACVIIPMFLIRMIGKYERKAANRHGKPYKIYLFKSTAKLGLHYMLIFSLPILAIRRLYYSIQIEKQYAFYGKGISLFSLFLILFTLVAVYHLSKFHSRGLIETGIVVVLGAVYKHCIWLGFAKQIINAVTDFKAVVKYGFYIMVDSIIARSMAVDVAVFGFILFLSFYYYKRRFLFMPEKLHMPKCTYCGKAILKGDSFCTCCGTSVSAESAECLIESLDEVKHCRKCGRIAWNGGCTICDPPEYWEKLIKEKSKEKRIAIARGVILSILFFGLLMLPQINNAFGDMQKGSGRANNVFVERWNAFDEQPDLASDSAWLAGFDADLNALYTIDSRWYYIKPRMITSNNLWSYALYAEASFMQMEVLEEISGFVHDAANGQKADDAFHNKEAEFQARFNETITAQQKAILPCADATSPWGKLGQFEYFCYDGLNYYLHGISVTYISVFIIIICLVMFAYILNSFSNTTETRLEDWNRRRSMRAEDRIRKHDVVHETIIFASVFYRTFAAMKYCGHSLVRVVNEIWMLFVRMVCMIGLFLSLFRPRNIKRCACWVKNGLTDDRPLLIVGEGGHIEFKRREKKEWKISIIIAIALLAVCFTIVSIGNYQRLSQKERYLQLVEEAVNGYSIDISAILAHIEVEQALSDKERKQLYTLLDNQIEVDRKILAYDMAELDDCLELHAGLCSLCEDDIKMIESIRESLDNNLVPSRELYKNYSSLRGENYIWILEELATERLELFVDNSFN